ncbi:unnamed protein product [Rhizophagus irregularis]|nr:unnamed protein product [Rhizophagus irregularis]
MLQRFSFFKNTSGFFFLDFQVLRGRFKTFLLDFQELNVGLLERLRFFFGFSGYFRTFLTTFTSRLWYID